MSFGNLLALVQLVFVGMHIGSASMTPGVSTNCRRPEMQPFLARACNSLGLQVYQETDHSGNVVLSPASICTALAVTMTFSKGGTFAELKKQDFLRWTTKFETSKIFRHLFQSFAKSHKVHITAKNVLFMNMPDRIIPRTAKVFQKFYNGTTVSLNPERKDADIAMDDYLWPYINSNVGSHIKRDNITSEEVLVLVNTMHLEASWKERFNTGNTRPMTYHVDNATDILVPMMYRRGLYRWNRNWKLKCDVLEIPYEVDRFAMYVILPHDKDGIEALENKLTPRTTALQKLISNMDDDPIETDLYLPKFSIRQTLGLNNVLMKAGIRGLFDKEKADLSGLIQGIRIYVDTILHQSTINVTEVGTIAGTYSKINFNFYSSYPTFNANHPFMYILRDKETEFNLFMGKYHRP